MKTKLDLEKLSMEDKAYITMCVLQYEVTLEQAQVAFLMGGSKHGDLICELLKQELPMKTILSLNAMVWVEYHNTKSLSKKLKIDFDEANFQRVVRQMVNENLSRLDKEGNIIGNN